MRESTNTHAHTHTHSQTERYNRIFRYVNIHRGELFWAKYMGETAYLLELSLVSI